MRNQTPKPSQIWQHYKGTEYQILAIAKNVSDGNLIDTVVYQDTKTGDVYCRHLTEFMAIVDADSESYYRFNLKNNEQLSKLTQSN
jgi:hypothetical protein